MIETPGRFHSKATDHVVAGADEILDDNLHKKQSVVNAENESFKEAQTELNEAQSDFNSEVREALGSGGTVDERIVNAVNTEKERAEAAEEALDGRVDTLEEAVGAGGSVDSRISEAVATEASRAQAVELNLNSGKADKATTLAGYGITDAYTKSETYTKTEVNGLVDTPHQEYVTVDAYANLPETGSKDTIYRVSNYNGSTSQVDASVYSEYAWDGSQYVFLCVKSQIGEVFDISVYNNNAKYADLAAALNGGANIPQSLQKGGMSVKYVQSSDNKYVHYNLLATTFTTDTTQWAIDDGGIYVDNPEFIYVKTDKEGKILWAIKADGSIYYGAGVPQQVIDYINEKIALSLDEYEDIVAFLNGLEEGDKTLQALLNEKVDKEEGKSLIDSEYADGVHYIENPEFVGVWTDNENKILFGIKANGDVMFGCSIPSQIAGVIAEINRVISDTNTRIAAIETIIDGFIKTPFENAFLPDTVFSLSYDSGNTRNILQSIKPIGCFYTPWGTDINPKLNNKREFVVNPVSASINIVLEDSKNKSEKVLNIINTDASVINNKSMKLMMFGDSLTQGCYPIYVASMFKDIVDSDIAPNFIIDYIGSVNFASYNRASNPQYINNLEDSLRLKVEGRGGFCLFDVIRHAYPLLSGDDSWGMSAATMWDSLGLGTLGGTRTYEPYSNSYIKKELIANTCHGYYDADATQTLWNWIVNKRGITTFVYDGVTYTFGNSYSSSEDVKIKAYIRYSCENPIVTTYDYNTMMSSGGQYAYDWNVFKQKYNLDNPTHIYIMMGTNDPTLFGTSFSSVVTSYLNSIEYLVNMYKSEIPNVTIGIGFHRGSGVCGLSMQEEWGDIGIARDGIFRWHYGRSYYLMNKALKEAIDNGDIDAQYVPVYYMESVFGNLSPIIDNYGKERYVDVGNTHNQGVTNYSIAAQIVSWLCSTLNN